jgi:GNAT superfamily N-acetyltransferase
VSLTKDEALAIQRRAMRDWVAMLGASAPDSMLDEGDGVTAALVPSVPTRSIANSVTYTDAASLFARHDELVQRYEAAGIQAWTVWAPAFEAETIAGLQARGHSFDGKPTAMVLELDGWEAPDLGDLDWDDEGDGQTAGALNDLAYGVTSDGFAPGLASPPDFVRSYRARIDGEVACVLATIDHEDDLGFYFVATHPDHRGKGLASRLMVAALADARERGFRTSSLQASKLGEPVYTRLGYEPYFRFYMYERRSL